MDKIKYIIHYYVSNYHCIFYPFNLTFRRCIEKTFGIMASKWLKIRRPIIATEETINAIVQATVVLHNYVKKYENREG